MKLPQRAQFMRTLIACVLTEVIRHSQICNKNRRSCLLRPPEVVALTKIITTSAEALLHVTKAQIGTLRKGHLSETYAKWYLHSGLFSATSVLKARYRGCVQCHQPQIIGRRSRYIRQGWLTDLQRVPYTIIVIPYVKVEWVPIPGLVWIHRPLKHIINLVEVEPADDLPPLRKPRSFSKIHRDSRLERRGEMIPKCDVDDLVRWRNSKLHLWGC